MTGVRTMETANSPRKVFLSVEDIADHLSDYQVFDARYSLKQKDYGRVEYGKSHIPGATFVDLDEDLCSPPTLSTGRHPLPEASAFVQWCIRRGVGARPALCYDDECGAMGGCRLWWMLHALGVEAYVLNGGFQAYREAGLPLETGPQPARNENQNGNGNGNQWPYATTFARAVAIGEFPVNAVMADARAAERFASTVRPYAADTLPGHIESAVSLPWVTNVIVAGQMKRLKPEDECRSNVLKALSGACGAAMPDLAKCVFYCGSGVSATFNIALVCHLGLGEPMLYCGSWSQYQTVFAFSIARHIVQTHGMSFKMISQNLGENEKASMENALVIVDGTQTSTPDAEVQEAIQHMHLWEKAQVFFKSGRVVVIETPPRR